MQAQNPHDPYYALWSRLESFAPEDLSGMLERREALRGALMRATLHISTTPDFMFLRSHLQETLAAVLGSTSFAKDTAGMDRAVLLDTGRSLLEEHPMTRADLARALEERWPGIPGNSMAQVVTYLLPVIQVPPRGLWGRSGAATWTTLESWVGSGLPNVHGPRDDHHAVPGRFRAGHDLGPEGVVEAQRPPPGGRRDARSSSVPSRRGRLRATRSPRRHRSSMKTPLPRPASSPSTTTSSSDIPTALDSSLPGSCPRAGRATSWSTGCSVDGGR